MRRYSLWLALVAVAALGLTSVSNWVAIHRPIQHGLAKDPRNEGIRIWGYYQHGVNWHHVVFDLRDVPRTKSKADVFRTLLQSAQVLKGRRFDSVTLAFRHRPKFVIPGDYFQKLGEEYDWQNPVYTMRTFPYHLANPDGTPAFEEPLGGWLYVLGQQMEDFGELHDRWYLREMAESQ